MADVTVDQYRPTGASMTLVDTLAEAFNVSWQQQISEPGNGSLTLPLDAFAGYDIQPGDLAVISVDATPVASFVIEVIDEHTLDDEGPGAETAGLTGRGPGGFLEWGVVVPANGIDGEPVEADRLFSWQSIDYVEGNDGQTWDEVVDAGDATGTVRVAGTQDGYPEGAPDIAGTKWIWGDSPTVDPSTSAFAPGGRVYARATLTLGSDTALLVVYSFDNYGQIWFDGQLIGALEQAGGPANFLKSYSYSLVASTGDHQLAVTAFNVGASTPGPKDNPGGIYVVVGSVDSDGEFNNAHIVTDTTDWNVLAYPSTPPGMTPGEAILVALGEVQARGGLGWVTVDFDGDDDSGGTPWPVVGDISTKTGTDLLTFLTELAVTYVDWVMSPDGTVLSAYVKDDYAQIGGAAVVLEPATVTDPTTGNLLRLDRKTT